MTRTQGLCVAINIIALPILIPYVLLGLYGEWLESKLPWHK